MLHEARTVHFRPLRARATMRSHQPRVPPSAPRVGAEGGQGEGEGASAVLYSTGAETVVTPFRRIAETGALSANVPLGRRHCRVL